MPVTCPSCLRPLPAVDFDEGGAPVPRTGDEALLMTLVGEGATTVREVAVRLVGDPPPSRAQLERVRRRLDTCVREGLLTARPPARGGEGGTAPTRYSLVGRGRAREVGT